MSPFFMTERFYCMQTEKLKQLVIDALNDLKGIDLLIMDIRTVTTIADIMIICTGSSSRHVKSLADNVVKKAKEDKLSYIRTEGEREGEWVIVDLADIIVHVMLPTMREFYNLEDLWAPIKEIREKRGNF
jgi:ribosome-associated protein